MDASADGVLAREGRQVPPRSAAGDAPIPGWRTFAESSRDSGSRRHDALGHFSCAVASATFSNGTWTGELGEDEVAECVVEWLRSSHIQFRYEALPCAMIQLPGQRSAHGILVSSNATMESIGDASGARMRLTGPAKPELRLVPMSRGEAVVMNLFEDKGDYFLVQMVCQPGRRVANAEQLLRAAARSQGMHEAAIDTMDTEELCASLRRGVFRDTMYTARRNLAKFWDVYRTRARIRANWSGRVTKLRYRAQDLLRHDIVVYALLGGHGDLVLQERRRVLDATISAGVLHEVASARAMANDWIARAGRTRRTRPEQLRALQVLKESIAAIDDATRDVVLEWQSMPGLSQLYALEQQQRIANWTAANAVGTITNAVVHRAK